MLLARERDPGLAAFTFALELASFTVSRIQKNGTYQS